MLHDDSFNTNDIVNFIDSTNFLDKESFNLSNVNFTEKLYGSTPSANKINLDEFKEKSFLILGSGKNLTKYESDIELFINKFKPTVIQLNSNNFFNQDLINYNIFLNPNKLATEMNDNQIKIKNVITTSTLAIQNEKISYKFVDVKVANTFSQQEFYIELPSSLVLGYALMLTTFSNLENVYLAGFDGYRTSDQKNSEVNLLIDKFVKAFSQKKLISLTPSQFNLDQQSIIGLVRQNTIN